MNDQAEIIAFLENPDSHDLPGETILRKDTQISHLFMIGDHAYKLKRAVKLPFLDFTKIEDRYRYCMAEFTVNRRTAPSLYHGVRKISRNDDGALVWDGPNEAVDWVIDMKRFDEALLLDTVAKSGHITTKLVQDLADEVVALHQSAEITPDWGGARGLQHVVATNDPSFRMFVPEVFAQEDIDRLTASTLAELTRLTPLLEARRLSGRVRRCHGDLHLGNICQIDGGPVLFDAIEFNEDFACIDVFYDLAFLLMDFDRRGMAEFAALLLSRSLALTRDIEALAALPLFLSLRAAIRAFIAAAMGQTREALDYRLRAQNYLRPVPPCLLAVGGLQGTGKSNLSRRLAPFVGARPGALVLRSDVARKVLMGVSPETKLPETAYSETVTTQVYRGLLIDAEIALQAGHSVILDGVYARPEQRRHVADLAQRLTVPFTGFWLEADREILRQRISERRHNASDATVEVLDRQMTRDPGPIDWHRLDSGGDKQHTLDQAMRLLGL